MIKYRLRCVRGHEFETWFQNSAAFDKLAKRHQLTCATCGSEKVEKAIMSPRIAKSGTKARATRGNEDGNVMPASAPGAPAVSGEDAHRGQALRAAMKALRQTVIGNADYVGPKFAEEARRIHDDEAPARGIYGEASIEEARELLEDGISILPLPPAADDSN
ncbi:MAG: DUF1178 family protein [Hyphomicrobiaceae bacterium]